ncbi:MAG: response regulator transcription factor [Bdellovibrionales bacterium]|nr:response regulator transcription factor [Bdellovibrionales bacterium]
MTERGAIAENGWNAENGSGRKNTRDEGRTGNPGTDALPTEKRAVTKDLDIPQPMIESPESRPSKGADAAVAAQVKKVLLVDAEDLVRYAIKQLIDFLESFEVVAEARDMNAALTMIDQSKPDIVLTEIALPGPSGLEFLLELQRKGLSDVRPVVLSQVDSPDMIRQALIAGAQGYVLKSGSFDHLVQGLEAARNNRKYLPPELGALGELPTNAYELSKIRPDDPLAPLSAREREIFHLLANGLQNTVIAKKLFISPRTVETHRARIVRKLGLTSNGELIRFAIKHGLTVV